MYSLFDVCGFDFIFASSRRLVVPMAGILLLYYSWRNGLRFVFLAYFQKAQHQANRIFVAFIRASSGQNEIRWRIVKSFIDLEALTHESLRVWLASVMRGFVH